MFLSSNDIHNITEWTYKVVDNSITTKFFTPFWNFIVSYIPHNISPNVLTLSGFICILYAYYLSFFLDDNYTFTCLKICFMIFAYMTLDAIDGKHSRQTKTSSPLGELLDHMCDAISTVFLSLLLCRVLNITDTIHTWYITMAAQNMFMSEHIRAIYTKTIVFNRYTGPGEALIVYLVIILSTIYDDTIFNYVLPRLDTFYIGLYMVTILYVCYTLFYIIKAKYHDISIMLVSIICLKIIQLISMYFLEPTLFNIIADGLVMAIITCEIIIVKMAHKNFHPYLTAAFICSLGSSFIVYPKVIFYIISIVSEISIHLNIPVIKSTKNVLCLGVFDMCHEGHTKLFINASKLGTTLYVGVHSDKDVESYKRIPYMTHDERVAAVKNYRGVYKVIKNAPLIIDEAFINKYNIHVVVCDQQYFNDVNDKYYTVPRNLGILKCIERTPNISTSELIQKIKNQ